jgi:hypothetical protein
MHNEEYSFFTVSMYKVTNHREARRKSAESIRTMSTTPTTVYTVMEARVVNDPVEYCFQCQRSTPVYPTKLTHESIKKSTTR